MADDPGKSYRDKLNSAADKALEVYDRNKRYKPSRETDKYILDRAFENLPFQRPETDPGGELAPNKHQQGEGYRYVERQQQDGDVEGDWFAPKTRSQLLGGWDEFEKDITTLSNYEKKPVPKSYNQREEESLEQMKRSLGVTNALTRSLAIGSSAGYGLTPQERQSMQGLQNELAELYTAPGAQEDRPGRLQEIKEALDLTNPDSGGRALLRELKRKMIDDKVPRIQAGHKTQTGEEFMLSKLKELGVSDTPATRGAILANLGMNKLPEKMPLLDDAGNPVPLYVDEMKAAREAAADKAYMQHRRDPMKDTPERD